MGNSNPRYLAAWPTEQLATGGGGTGTVTSVGAGSGLLGGPITGSGSLSVNYGTSADILAGTDNIKLFTAAALSGASVAGISAGAGDAGKFVKLGPTGFLSPSVLGTNAIDLTAGVADAGKLVKTDATGKIDASFLPPLGGTGTVTSVTAGTGLTGGTISTTGTIALATSGAAAGTYTSVTVDTYGRVTAGTNPTTLSGYGITDAAASTVTITGNNSLTGGGDLTANRTISLVNDSAAPGNAMYYGTDAGGVKGWQAFPAVGGTGTVTNIVTGPGLTGGPISTTGTISLDASGATAGTSGSGTQIPVVTVDTYGRITSITTATNAPDWANVTSKPTTLAGYGITDATSSTRQITAGTGLTGGGDLTADRTISLATSGVTAGTYGSATQASQVTVDAYGRITSATAVTITPAWANITGTPTTLAGYGITDGVAATRQITGVTSLTGGGDLTADRTISLVGDAAAPGNSFYYGTDGTGVKGFHALPAGGGTGTVTSVATGTGLTGGPFTTSGTIALADTAITPGTYQGITFDQQGRATAAVDAGYVVGPASATDNAIARYDLATGKLIQNSVAILDDSGNLSGVNNLTTTGNTTLGDAAADTYTLNGSTMAVPNGLNIDSNTLVIDATNDRVGFGTATPASAVDVTGTAAHSVVTTTGAMDLATGQMFVRTSTANTTWSFANVPAGRGSTVVLHLTNGGAHTQTWPATVKWPGGTAPTLTSAGTDVLVFVTHDGGTTWRGNIFGKDVK